MPTFCLVDKFLLYLCDFVLTLSQAASTTFGICPNAPSLLDDDTTVVVTRIQMPSQQLCLNELQTHLDALDQAYDADDGISCYCIVLCGSL